MRRLREDFKRKALALVAKLLKKGDIEAVRDLAEAFPLEVFPDAVGLTPAGRENLLPYSTMVFNSFGPRNDIFQSSTQAAEPVLAWIHAQCARGACADVGFAADIWAAHDAGEITAEEAPILVRSLLTAGLDTTVNGFANAILAFATHPEQWQRVRADRSLLKPAFDEVLRWESPVQTFFRTTTRAVEVGPVEVPEGEKVLLFLGAANRDPRKWPEPEKFDVTRRPLGHVGLGAGIHVCVGQLVARLEAEVMFEALADHVAAFELTARRSASRITRCGRCRDWRCVWSPRKETIHAAARQADRRGAQAMGRRGKAAAMTGGMAIVEALVANGVEVVFGLPGAQLYPLFDALQQKSDAIRTIGARTSRPAATWPSATRARPGGRASMPWCRGRACSTRRRRCARPTAAAPPSCASLGKSPRRSWAVAAGTLHELPDQLGTLRTLDKWAARIERPADAPEIVNEAFRQMLSGRPGPVAIEMAWDTMATSAFVAPLGPATIAKPPPPRHWRWRPPPSCSPPPRGR